MTAGLAVINCPVLPSGSSASLSGSSALPGTDLTSLLSPLTVSSRNAIVVILCLILAMVVDKDTFTLTSEIDSGLPAFQPPPFSVTVNTTHTNSSHSYSYPETKGLGEMLSNLGAAVIIIPMIAILESVAIAKAFGN